MSRNILVVDDNSRIFESLAPNFRLFGIDVLYAASKAETERQLMANEVDAVLLDIMLGKENGIDVLRKIKKLHPEVPVIMITGYGSIDTAVESMKIGAFDYVKKPLNFDRLVKIMENAIELHKLSHENTILKHRLQELSPQVHVKNSVMRGVVEQAEKLAHTNIPVLIVGENGSGKEVIADFIHANSERVVSKMIKSNCSAFPESLLDNELFGHNRGAYTGAEADFHGVFERADGSTLFLDEIGDMPLTVQSKILRVLQNSEIRRIGGAKTFEVDVRFVAATNKDLGDLMNKGHFRQDLFYRLNTAIISIPPLRERREDVILLAQHFLQEFSGINGKEIDSIDPQVLELFAQYSWPGNVRELRNTINYSVAITSGTSISLADLPPLLRQRSFREPPSLDIRQAGEKSLIEQSLRKYKFNKKRTAEILNMSRKTLYAKIRKYNIDV